LQLFDFLLNEVCQLRSSEEGEIDLGSEQHYQHYEAAEQDSLGDKEKTLDEYLEDTGIQ